MRDAVSFVLGFSCLVALSGCRGTIEVKNLELDGLVGDSGAGGGSGTTGGSSGLTGQGGSSQGGSGQGGTGQGGTGLGGTAGNAGGGGLSGQGGSATGGRGTGGAPPVHVVAKCDALPAVNQWESITPPGVNSEYGVLTVLVDPVHSGTIYAGTDKRGVHKSTDCGATWNKVNTGTGSANIDGGYLWSMALNPERPEILYAGSLYSPDNSLLRSKDSGVNWVSLFPPGSEIATHVEYNFLQEVGLDPSNPDHLVVSFHAPCKAPYAPMCMAESLDGGDTWRMFKGPADGWVENARPLVIDATSFLYVTGQNGVFYTSNNGATWETLDVPGANHQMYQRNDGTLFLGTYAGVYQSTNGRNWTKIDGSPAANGLTGDGERIFGALSNDRDAKQPYYTAPETAGAPWAKLPSPPVVGSVHIEYDKGHHLIYSATQADGLWRMVTQEKAPSD